MARFIKLIRIFLILLPFNSFSQSDNFNNEFKGSSVLSSGKWIKIAITAEGIYKIEFRQLKEAGLEYPSYPRIFGNNYGQLSYYNRDPKPDDLKEIAIFKSTGNDGIFNDGDYLLFYGQGTGRWVSDYGKRTFKYNRHIYSDTAFYFITSSPGGGKEIGSSIEPQGEASRKSSEYDILHIHEFETENLIRSGREWYQPFPVTGRIDINTEFNELILNDSIKYSIKVLSRASSATEFRLYSDESLSDQLFVPGVNLSSQTGAYAQIATKEGSLITGSSNPSFYIRFLNNGATGAKAWIDYAVFHARSKKIFKGQPTVYFDQRTVIPGSVTEFTIQSQTEMVSLWDVTDPYNVKKIIYKKSGQNIVFKSTTDTLRRFFAFNDSGIMNPVFKPGLIKNQNLHASPNAEMIILTHPFFERYARKLAGIHQTNSGLESLVVFPEQIYNEFSGGIPDISAIRNFVRMKYLKQKNSKNPLRYLLLFGDGSYENKTPPPRNPNFIPTYQSQNSNVFISSFTSDDFYGLLDYDEGEDFGTEDIGIGRLPVADTVQAGLVVLKIDNYINRSEKGEWKNIACIVADDEDGNTHMEDAEGLADILESECPEMNIDKIYFDAFPQVSAATGQFYPEVTRAINDRISSGCLIFNYTGHGNETGLAHERVLKSEDIASWTNGTKLPLFITATCEFSRFDDVEMNYFTGQYLAKGSAGEKVLLNVKGGGIALMSTVRLVYSAPNYELNRNLFEFLLDRDSAGNGLRLGDIIRLAKNKTGGIVNKRNFVLLGDPAVRLAYPFKGNVVTDSLNHKSVKEKPDTLKALSHVTIAGHLEDDNGNIVRDFNGIISPVVFDKPSRIMTLANDGGKKMEFEMYANRLYNGKAIVREGRFEFSFMVPRDIDYRYGQGRISYYAFNSDTDINGSFVEFTAGGFSGLVQTDDKGPSIRLFLNDTLFRDGGMTDSKPRLLAIIGDESGINASGKAIGHDITAFLDDRTNSFILNDYYATDQGSFSKGRIMYTLPELSPGPHSITLKAWDNLNNSSEKSLQFVVNAEKKLWLKNLYNYPNPFTNETKISLDHNRPDTELSVTIKIYSVTGNLIKIIEKKEGSTGYRLAPVSWDGTGEGGQKCGKGVYPYVVTIKTVTGETASISGRMIIL